MVSAFMTGLLLVGGGGLAGVVRRERHLGPRPLSEQCEEARDVRGDLPGVLGAQITTNARLPDLAGAVDQRLSFATCDGFTEDLTGGSSPLRAPGLRSRNPTDDARPDVICILSVPIAGIAAIGAASARQFVLGDRELVALAGVDDEFAAFAAIGNLAGDGILEESMPQTVDDKTFETVESLADLSALGALARGFDLRVIHCAVVPSCP